MRKTESKMNDLSVTGKIVSSGYKTRNQQSKTSNQPVRPQRRYSGVHKVNHKKKHFKGRILRGKFLIWAQEP